MSYEATISFIKQRMREFGISSLKYHFEPVVISGTPIELAAQKIEIKADNQYYYLVNGKDLSGVQIESDSGYFNSDEPYRNTLPEFTGQILITPSGITTWNVGDSFADGSYLRIRVIEFIRVTIL